MFPPRFSFLLIAAVLCAVPVATMTAQAAAPRSIAANPGAPAPDEAERIYSAYGDAIYQVQVIDLASGKKSSIGSGFQIAGGDEDIIATNFHVVAEAIQRPTENRLEYLHDRGEHGKLTIIAADAVHDLALVRMEKTDKKFPRKVLQLGTSRLPKGTKMFSLGNPHDIGFTIVEGTYNGLSRESFYDKIHFSGALNPGMSGGPVLGHDGRVVGINDATAGNQIGFLVPVEPLRALLDGHRKNSGGDFLKSADAGIEKELLQSQKENIDQLMKKNWESVSFAGLQLPGRIDPVFKCWGGAAHQEKDPYTLYRSACSTQEGIFLDQGFTTGNYAYRYDLIRAKPALNLLRFYSLYNQLYATPMEESGNVGEENAGNFSCNDHFVEQAGHLWKASFCLRQYKKYKSLYDMQLYMAMVNEGPQGVIISVAANGVSRDNALVLAQKFISEIRPGTAPTSTAEIPAAPADKEPDQKPDQKADGVKTP